MWRPFLFCGTVGGGQATFMARPYAPRKEWLSRMIKAPGSLSFNRLMAERGRRKEREKMRFLQEQKRDKKTKQNEHALSSLHSYEKICLKGPRLVLVSPCSLEMSGLYQNLDVSWTNFTFILMSGYPSVWRDRDTLTGGQSLSCDRTPVRTSVSHHKWTLGHLSRCVCRIGWVHCCRRLPSGFCCQSSLRLRWTCASFLVVAERRGRQVSRAGVRCRQACCVHSLRYGGPSGGWGECQQWPF